MKSIYITSEDHHAYIEWCKAKNVFQFDLERFKEWTDEQAQEEIIIDGLEAADHEAMPEEEADLRAEHVAYTERDCTAASLGLPITLLPEFISLSNGPMSRDFKRWIHHMYELGAQPNADLDSYTATYLKIKHGIIDADTQETHGDSTACLVASRPIFRQIPRACIA